MEPLGDEEFTAAFEKLKSYANGRMCFLYGKLATYLDGIRYTAFLEMPPIGAIGLLKNTPMEAVDACIEDLHNIFMEKERKDANS